ncbi:MAG: FHA domain-containing protein [Ardenticatenaceae bacterium]|nr:FHA domain-containing protein [Ardenticatenaceae bacterium]
MKKATLFMTLFLLLFTTILTVQAATPTAVRIQTIIQGSQPQDPAVGGIPSSIYYILVDENGRPLTDVSIEDSSVSVTLDGVPQGPVTSAIPNTPLFVAMTLDISTSMQPYQEEMGAAVTQAINSAPDIARFGLLTFDHEIHPPDRYLADRHLLQDSLRGITIPEWRDTCLYDAANAAVLSLAAQIEQMPEIRRAVILFTDGKNEPSQSSPCQYDEADVADIITYAQEQQIAIYTISFGNKADVVLLETLAQETGGIAFTGEGSMEQKFSEVMRSLNNQRVAHTTLFPETAGKHTLTLNVRVSGETQETEAIEAGSLVIETVASPTLAATLTLVEHDYEPARQQIAVTIEAKNADAIDCFMVKLRDMETMETIGNRQVCNPEEGRSAHILENLPKLVDGRSYRLEVDAQQKICPTEESAGENNPCLRPFTVRLNTIPFSFEVQPQPELGQIQVMLRELDIQAFPWVEYHATILQDGVTLPHPFEGVLNDPTQPITLPYYPEAQSGSDAQISNYKIQITLSTNDAEGQASQEVAITLRQPPGFFARLGDGLNQRPFLSTTLLFLLIALPLLYFGRGWLERQLPGTRFLFSRGVNGRATSPIKPVTQLPTTGWTPPAPQPKPTPPASDPPAKTAAPPILRILQAPAKIESETVAVAPLPFRIGREGCHLTLGDDRTSRTHATIQRIGHQYFITDMGSTNGTFLNDDPDCLAPNMRWPLAHGDHIRLGTTIALVFTIPEPALHRP